MIPGSPADFSKLIADEAEKWARVVKYAQPNDNQGIRYLLARCLMTKGNTEALKKLLKQYDEDGSALWVYTKALVAFRENHTIASTESATPD